MESVIRAISESNLWGVDLLILVCVGGAEYKFERLLKAIDELCDIDVLKGNEIVAQIGYNDYEPRNYHSFKLCGRDEFQGYIDEAKFIITHAGTGSIVPALKQGNKIIVFPRREEYQEHLDNHQLEISELFTQQGYIMCANNSEELKEAILKVNEFKAEKFISNQNLFNQFLVDIIEME